MDFDLRKLIAANYTFLVVLILLLMASGCAWEPPPSACPPLEEYSDEFNGALANQLEALPMPDNWAIVEAVGDYYVLRKMARECE